MNSGTTTCGEVHVGSSRCHWVLSVWWCTTRPRPLQVGQVTLPEPPHPLHVTLYVRVCVTVWPLDISVYDSVRCWVPLPPHPEQVTMPLPPHGPQTHTISQTQPSPSGSSQFLYSWGGYSGNCDSSHMGTTGFCKHLVVPPPKLVLT